MESTPGLTVQQAYNIDQKIDDGFPQSGNLTAQYVDYYPSSAAAQWAGAADTAATAGSSATCYDNSASTSGTPGVAGAIQHYSVEMNNGAGINCTLSFKFQ